MALGLWYDANYDANLVAQRLQAEDLCFKLNKTAPSDTQLRENILSQLLPKRGKETVILSPFMTDYGFNCSIGDYTFINHNAYLMDGAPIVIGAHCFIGPNCGFYTASHPLLSQERNHGWEKALPITLGDNVWLGAGVMVLPGVTIGDDAVIGAGSVVTHDIPSGCIAFGSPCKIVRELTESDSIARDLAVESAVAHGRG